MKKLKVTCILAIFAAMFAPTVVGATNDYYSDSWMMYRYADDSPSGSNCRAVTAASRRLTKVGAGVYNADGTGNQQIAAAGKVATVSLWTNRYYHKHNNWDIK